MTDEILDDLLESFWASRRSLSIAALVTEVDFKGCRSEFITGAERGSRKINFDR